LVFEQSAGILNEVEQMDVRNINSLARVYQEQINISNHNKDKKAKASQAKDEVVLSSRAIEFSHTVKALKNSPEIREEKIREISERIASGTYNVSSDVIADSIMTYSRYH
jgi:negative regulator of flagellin synthesis FlgM